MSNATRAIRGCGRVAPRRHAALGVVLALATCASAAAAGTSPPERTVGGAHLDVRVVLAVADAEAVSDALTGRAAELGGHLARRTGSELVLRVPQGRVEALTAAAREHGTLIERTLESTPVGGDLTRTEASLAAREAALDTYLAVLGRSDRAGVVSVEKELVKKIDEIEDLRGRVRALAAEAETATVTISYRLPDRAAPAHPGRSSFPWLNQVGLGHLLEDFTHE